ncbi:MAG TPA: hypothetical protein VLK65_26410 [Vicinamibacteria bacterium]|nr:hypothetical protein [Vicinamibacteria bacterium]
MKIARIAILVALILVGLYIVTSTSKLGKVSCEVCMEFRGESICRTASGVSLEEAVDTARNNACAQIARGRTESILCGGSEPTSVQCDE